jgi:Uncharacterised nucleotidyltransferase
MTPTVDTLVARVAAEGLPPLSPSQRTFVDDDAFGALLDAASRERITGHLEQCLKAGVLEVSDANRHEAKRRHVAMLANDLILERLLAQTSARFAAAAIPHLALKGPVVARTAYPNRTLRSFGDVDLLVRSDRFDDAVSLLVGDGGHARYRQPRRQFTARFGKGVCVVTQAGLEIDLHRVFVAGPFGLAINVKDLFTASEFLTIAGLAVPIPSAPVRFLHACYHAALTKPRITAFRDVAQIACKTNLDTDAVLDLAARWRGRLVVQRALRLTRARLPAALDGRLYRWAEQYEPDRFEVAALRAYTAEDTTYAQQTATGMRAIRGLRNRAAYGMALLIPERRYVAEREGGYVRRWRHALSLVRPSRGGS